MTVCCFMISNSSAVNRPGLQQDAVGNSDFADVVQGTGQINRLDEFAVDDVAEFRLFGQRSSTMIRQYSRIRSRWRARFGIARFGELGQAENRHVAAGHGQDSLPGPHANTQFVRLKRLASENHRRRHSILRRRCAYPSAS